MRPRFRLFCCSDTLEPLYVQSLVFCTWKIQDDSTSWQFLRIWMHRVPFYIQAFFPVVRKIFPSIGWQNKSSRTQSPLKGMREPICNFFSPPSSQNRKWGWQFCNQKVFSLISRLRAQLSRDSLDTHRHDRSPLLRGCGKSRLPSLDAAEYIELYAHWHTVSAHLSIRCYDAHA